MKGLNELGVQGFAYVISDPDSHSFFWGRGINCFWQEGALRWLVEKNKLDNSEDKDLEGDEWKGDS